MNILLLFQREVPDPRDKRAVDLAFGHGHFQELDRLLHGHPERALEDHRLGVEPVLEELCDAVLGLFADGGEIEHPLALFLHFSRKVGPLDGKLVLENKEVTQFPFEIVLLTNELDKQQLLGKHTWRSEMTLVSPNGLCCQISRKMKFEIYPKQDLDYDPVVDK